ncbi:MAG: elongation factor P [Candidatus Dormiibacterota bacterium]|jgi:elongation factor P|nr:elongation factor P [Candidatus Dormibacteraeota bacterium]
MIEAGDLRPGSIFERDGQLIVCVTQSHMKMGRGTAQVRAKLRNLITGAITDETFRPEQRFPRVRIDKNQMQYLYGDGDQHHFMDTATYDQVAMGKEQLGDALSYLKEGSEIQVLSYEGKPIGVELPTSVDLEVVETDPGFKGDTATGGSKPAKVETGITVQVPLFVNQGDRIKVDTRSGEYMERA